MKGKNNHVKEPVIKMNSSASEQDHLLERERDLRMLRDGSDGIYNQRQGRSNRHKSMWTEDPSMTAAARELGGLKLASLPIPRTNRYLGE